MSSDETQKKWDGIYSKADDDIPAAAHVLAENRHLLPSSGRALEIACGRGGNALLLAQHGLETHAWDISPVAIERLQHAAAQSGLVIHGKACDVVSEPLEPHSFDVIVVSHFLERSLFSAMRQALRSDGLLFYQTFTRTRVAAEAGAGSHGPGPQNTSFRLGDNELLTLCHGLQVLVYREEGRCGDPDHGLREMAMIVARRLQGSLTGGKLSP